MTTRICAGCKAPTDNSFILDPPGEEPQSLCSGCNDVWNRLFNEEDTMAVISAVALLAGTGKEWEDLVIPARNARILKLREIVGRR